ncbi:MAG: ADP-ribosylglycohydrolase family protein [Treponema sp.]|nr:ADP-ribosylglycohydrolase family protein [Treponema sp.]
MLGAIIGDIIGSRFEAKNAVPGLGFKSPDFCLFNEKSVSTDDSIMTMAIAKTVWQSKNDFSKLGQNSIQSMQEFGRKVKYAGYGGTFRNWLWMDNPKPYYSCGNGAAMRVSPVAFAAKSLEECRHFAVAVTEVTHNHPEGIKGGVCEAECVWLAKNGASKEEIKKYVEENYYSLDFTLDEIRPTYNWDVTCQGSLPQAIKCFLEADSYEQTVRLAVSLGGDCDTQAAMAGAIAEAFYGLPDSAHNIAKQYCLPEMFCYVQALEYVYNNYKGDLLDETKTLLEEIN